MHNERTYPNLLRLFGELGVATQESEMSMSVRCEGCGLEYAGARGLRRPVRAAVATSRRPAYLRMLAEVRALPPARPPACSPTSGAGDVTLGAFLAAAATRATSSSTS